MSRPISFIAAALVVLAPLPLSGQANPFEGDPMAIRAGRALFANRCADCHGADARGFSGPDLTALWAEGTTDERIFRTIRNGVSGSIMPSSSAPDQEVWGMVAFLRSISTVPEFESDVGDVERGQELFQARCSRCHRVDGEGGRLGPDLSRIAQVRTRDALIRSIREPGEAVGRGYRPVRVVTDGGEEVRGALKGEDAFSVQIMDTRQRLRGFLTSELSQVEAEEGSLMPSYGTDRLSDTELDDLVRYLGTLRGRS